MAPIEPDLSNSNTVPIALFSAYVSATSFLLYVIGYRVLFQAHGALPPSQSTRFREGARRKQVEIFGALAFLSLAFAVSYGYNFLKLSYQVWAFERGVTVPTGLFGQYGVFSRDVGQLQLGRWLRDTDLLSELWEIAMEKTRRRWWSQQLLLTTGPWSLYVAIQGRRRNIPHLWAFAILAPLTSLSLSMNLFFLAVLWTPVRMAAAESTSLIQSPTTVVSPSSRHKRKSSKTAHEVANAATTIKRSLWDRSFDLVNSYIPPKPQDWAPHPLVYVVPLLMTAADTLLLTLASNTPSFKYFLRDMLCDALLPLVLPRILPLAAGKSSSSETAARSRALTAFRTTAVLSTVFYVLQTVVSLIDSDPGAHRHRHSLLYFHLDAERSKTARTRSAFSRVLSSLADHPSVGRVGWDALLCGVSLAAWASIRGLEPQKLLRAAGWASKSELEAASEVKALVAKELKQITQGGDKEHEEEDATPKRKGRRRASTKSRVSEGDEAAGTGEAFASYPTDVQRGDEENETELENGAVAWGMMALSGLATGAASVLGADVGL